MSTPPFSTHSAVSRIYEKMQGYYYAQGSFSISGHVVRSRDFSVEDIQAAHKENTQKNYRPLITAQEFDAAARVIIGNWARSTKDPTSFFGSKDKQNTQLYYTLTHVSSSTADGKPEERIVSINY